MSTSNISFTGHLKPGQETTTNTYIGHVFFFTLSADKSIEIARYYIDGEQVRRGTVQRSTV